MQYAIQVIPESYPFVLRPCARCGVIKPFYPVDEVRINAQKKRLDIWLIHRCQTCGQTWNFELFARIAPDKLERTLYERLLVGDPELTRRYAFDAELHARKGAPLCSDTLQYRLEGAPVTFSPTEPMELLIHCDVPLGVRISKLLREALDISGTRLTTLVAEGVVVSPDGLNLLKAKMGTACRVLIGTPL